MAEEKEESGLYLLSTPIGNLEDMTFRAVRTLQEADLIAAEDTRQAKKLLNHFEISKPVTSYHMHNEKAKTDYLLEKVEAGEKVVVLSDAGTPAIADPGFYIVRAAVERQIEPVIIPGVSALTFAAVAAAFPVDKFVFAGFLPPKRGKRHAILERLKETDMTAFVFESPYKIQKLLTDVAEVFGDETPVAVVREATKFFEEVLRYPVKNLIELYKDRKWKGEIVLAIDVRNASKQDEASES